LVRGGRADRKEGWARNMIDHSWDLPGKRNMSQKSSKGWGSKTHDEKLARIRAKERGSPKESSRARRGGGGPGAKYGKDRPTVPQMRQEKRGASGSGSTTQ